MNTPNLLSLAIALAFTAGLSASAVGLPGFAAGAAFAFGCVGVYGLGWAADRRKPEPWGEL